MILFKRFGKIRFLLTKAKKYRELFYFIRNSSKPTEALKPFIAAHKPNFQDLK
jgi:hypothetical protein